MFIGSHLKEGLKMFIASHLKEWLNMFIASHLKERMLIMFIDSQLIEGGI